MNSTPAATPSMLASKAEYLAFNKRWKELARAKKITREDCLMRGLLLGQDLDEAMPVTRNPVRLANGALQASGRAMAIRALSSASPVSAAARRSAAVAAHAAGGRAPPDWVLQLTWAERWGMPHAPQDVSLGLSLETLLKVIQSASAVSLG